MAEIRLQVTDSQITAITAHLRPDAPTIEELIIKDYVEATDRSYAERLRQQRDAKVATFTDESKQLIAAFDQQKEAEKDALVAAEEGKEENQPKLEAGGDVGAVVIP